MNTHCAAIFIVFGLLPLALAIITPTWDDDVFEPSYSQIISSLLHFAEWKQTRQQYVKFSTDYPFGYPNLGCSTPIGFLAPVDVHSLAPWNIQVIGAIGDSLTAGRSAAAVDFAGTLEEYRGVSFPMGGDDAIEVRATLPALFSHFNPALVGASLNASASTDLKLSHFNVAKSGAFASDLPRQAKELVRRMKLSSEIDFENDWKFVNLFIGSNDLCKYCENTTRYGAEQYAAHVKEAVLYLRNHLPRTYVNLMPAFNVQVLRETQQTNPFCADFHKISCPCLTSIPPEELTAAKKQFDDSLQQFHDGCYQLDTFAVSVNPIIANIDKLPYMGSTVNLAFLALDCFHFSTIAHDMVAKLVWNSLFEPLSSRKSLAVFDEVNPRLWDCPPKACPYLRTTGNSASCGEQNPAKWPAGQAVKAETIAQPQLPSLAELERRADSESSFSLFFLLFAVIFAVLAISFALIVRDRKRKNPRASERTPLLLTANLYDDVF